MNNKSLVLSFLFALSSFGLMAQRLNEIKIVGGNFAPVSLGIELQLAPKHSIQLNVGYNLNDVAIDTFVSLSSSGGLPGGYFATVASEKISTIAFQGQYRYYLSKTSSFEGWYGSFSLFYKANLTGYEEYNRKSEEIKGYSFGVDGFNQAGAGVGFGYKKIVFDRLSLDFSINPSYLYEGNGISIDMAYQFQVGYAFNFRKSEQLETEL